MSPIRHAHRQLNPSRSFTIVELPVVSPRKREAFTLVELLVVVGIISLLIGLMLPALTKAREASNATKCLNNLRQIGMSYYMYAQANRDMIPLGVSTSGPITPQPLKRPGPATQPADYPVALNHFLYVNGCPSAAGGPFVATGLLAGRNGRVFYCPSEIHGKAFRYNTDINPWPELARGLTTRISYAVRPVRSIWAQDLDGPGYSCSNMPKLVKQKSYALMAELPQVPPYNHGTGATTFLHALYGDGSVRLVYSNAFKTELETYLSTGDKEPGFTQPSAEACYSEDKSIKTIWWVIDHN